jgi:hypothetical protein
VALGGVGSSELNFQATGLRKIMKDISNPFISRSFLKILFLNFVWQNISEIFRYFVFVMPMMRATFPQIPDIAPMNLKAFAIWSAWGIILLISQNIFTWMYLERFGNTVRNSLIIGTIIWLSIFGLFWIALYNLNLATLTILGYALSFSWIEMIISALIVHWGMRRFSDH